jgi:RHS repeat-associated protein
MVTDGFVTLIYDGDGNRVSETVGGVTTNYLVDTQNPTGYAQVVDELQSGTVTRAYSFGLERISETQTLNSVLTTSFYGYDGHGSVRQLTSSTGATTDTYDYDAFGNLVNSTGTTPNNYLFAGEQDDPALGLYYNRARYLNSATGRFWNFDTDEGDDERPASLNKYLYTEGDPVDNLDPTGNEIDAVAAFSIGATLDALPIVNAFGGSSGSAAGPSIGQLATAANALSDAQILAANALLALEAFGESSKTFKKYFGTTPEPIVEVPFLNTAFALSSSTVNWRVDNSCRTPQVGAYVYSGTGTNPATVYLCNPKFFSGSVEWPDSAHPHFSRAGMIFHEFTHLAASTNDGPNAPSDAGPISGKKPGAINNAYNLQFFAEDEAVKFR